MTRHRARPAVPRRYDREVGSLARRHGQGPPGSLAAVMSDGEQNAASRASGHEEEAGQAPRMRAVLGRMRRPGPLVAISVGYLVLVSGVMIGRGISVSPDYLLLILVPVAALSGRLAAFARDWVPFVALFLGYEALRRVAPKLGIRPQVASMVRLEKAVFFGRVPSQVLQRHLGGIHPLVTAATVIYFCHFLFPIAAGLVLWLASRAAFRRFAAALLAMSFAAFLIFLLIPRPRPGTLTTRAPCPASTTWSPAPCRPRSAPTTGGLTPTPSPPGPPCTRPTPPSALWPCTA